MQRFLILNADDFGLSPRVNDAVLRAHTQGVLTSASLMVTEPGFHEALQIAQTHPTLGVGLHIVVSCDHALLPPKSIPHIVNSNGRFGADPLRVGLRYALSKAAQKELYHEMEAQFARFAATGLPWSHVDGHQHMHLHPAVLDPFLALCRAYNIYRIRLPFEEFFAHWRNGGDHVNLNIGAALFLRLLRRRALRILHAVLADNDRQPSFFYCDRVYGQLQSGNMHLNYVVKLLQRLEGATNEIYFHPGTDYAKKLPKELQPPSVEDVELHALLHPSVRTQIAVLELQTGTYIEAEQFASRKAIANTTIKS
ncbi:hopanoid biosynthesis associated protein HpnK [Chthonomonas calidirosea]|uniref:Hopanoid biosynthesis associated protein HpnK n=1 Tax=Chthonomonas calidirosea (strain DSM 23976 / ICMP 18418 / T49) TaxID=1303518 RepID=S0EUX2_CHTCT|nr:hopanoid biosynthesis-associated protein HpnK [Chthonomonas calidirosea]CCW35518.1 hopanoid biosynthesis associated protein HpnK [Chthonomonas calidirosea T49]CEK20032.1 hopanoid biosynthesis associated protein HpnK [Chthonomonas calidirosea]